MEYRVRKRNLEKPCKYNGQIVTDAMIRRFHARAGFTVTSQKAIEHTRAYFSSFLQKIVDGTLAMVQHHRRITNIRLTDVLKACRHYGIRVYGYDDMCALEGPWGIEEFHITEMLDAHTCFRDPNVQDELENSRCELFKQTNFAQNFIENVDYEDESSDEEWLWNSDSNSDCDSEAESNSDNESECNDSELEGMIIDEENGDDIRCEKRWIEHENQFEKYADSLREAQKVVDAELLIREPEEEMLECDAPMGQGYYSDCDVDVEPTYMLSWKQTEESEDARWKFEGRLLKMEEQCTESILDCEAESEPEFVNSVDSCEYIIARQIFMKLFHDKIGMYSINITPVALSALHNVAEQYLHNSLTQGALQSQVSSLIMEECLDTTTDWKLELEQERQKVKQVEKAMIDLQSSFTTKQLEMQQKIEELQQRLGHLQPETMNQSRKIDESIQRKISPAKRKESCKNNPILELEQSDKPLIAIVGSLRSRLNGSKKAKVNPI